MKILKQTKLIFFVVLIALLCSCSNEDRNEKAIEWINSHKKPIIVTKTTVNGWTYNFRYSLQSSDNQFFYAGELDIALPDTIK